MEELKNMLPGQVPKRKGFQFRLRTLVLLVMLCASIFAFIRWLDNTETALAWLAVIGFFGLWYIALSWSVKNKDWSKHSDNKYGGPPIPGV
jgi:hypothetical protein